MERSKDLGKKVKNKDDYPEEKIHGDGNKRNRYIQIRTS